MFFFCSEFNKDHPRIKTTAQLRQPQNLRLPQNLDNPRIKTIQN